MPVEGASVNVRFVPLGTVNASTLSCITPSTLTTISSWETVWFNVKTVVELSPLNSCVAGLYEKLEPTWLPMYGIMFAPLFQ